MIAQKIFHLLYYELIHVKLLGFQIKTTTPQRNKIKVNVNNFIELILHDHLLEIDGGNNLAKTQI